MIMQLAIKMMFGSIVLFTFFMTGNYALATFFSNDFTASTINHGFPIPSEAELVKEEVELEEYRWDMASEQKHLSFSYNRVIKQWRWKKNGEQVVTSFYEKQGERVMVTILDDYFWYRESRKKKGERRDYI